MSARSKQARRPGPHLLTLSKIVHDYLRCYGRYREWVQYHRKQRPLKKALDVVASWKDQHGKVYSHQSRVPRAAKTEAGSRIRALELAGVRTFEDLFRHVEDAIGRSRGIGDLTVYDVATRIGASLDLWPERVYVYAGVRQGVRALGLDGNQRTVAIEAFPRELRRLEPWQVEDAVRIYADAVWAIGAPRRQAA